MARKRPPSPIGSPIADRRKEFARITRQSPRDPEAERMFVEGKLAMLRTDPRLSEAEKQRAAQDLERTIKRKKR